MLYSKWIKDLNTRTVKILEEDIGEKLGNIGLGNDFFLDTTPKAKINKCDYIRLNNFCTAKQTNKQKTEWKGSLQHGRKYWQTMYLIRG